MKFLGATGPKGLLLPLVIFLISTESGWARSFRTSMMPNGSVNSCANCHFFPGGPRNAFGLDVEAIVGGPNATPFWSAALAALDSDGDGASNGLELGDQDGDGQPVAGAKVTNPGDPSSVPPPVNVPPSISIVAPTNGFFVTMPGTVTIEATATDTNGTVAFVEFFDGPTSLGQDNTSPFSLTITLNPGSHALSAVAMDDQGTSSTSAVVNVTVTTVPIDNPITERIPKGDITIELRTIAAGMISPLGMAVPDDGSGRLFVYDQAGFVWVVTSAGRSPDPLLDVRTRLVNIGGNYDERGLLGLAVHPDFARHPLLYTYTSEPSAGLADFKTTLPAGATNNHQSVVAEWRLDAANSNRIDLASRRELLRIDQPQANHNGGTMHFGLDGHLYIAIGDGGGSDDEGIGHSAGGNAQDTNNVFGSILRIDVNGTNSANGQYGVPSDNSFVGSPGVDEIYAYGLRNPFGFSFDRVTGELYAGDVGQNKVEEINLVQKGGNYGWNIKEGAFYFDPNGTGSGYVTTTPVRPVPAGLVDPIAQYDHDDGASVFGGYVYRGREIGALAGRYVFGDWGVFGSPAGRLFYLDADRAIKELRIGLDDRPLGYYLKGFGEDAAGELYVIAAKQQGPAAVSGLLMKIVPAPASTLTITSHLPDKGDRIETAWTGGLGPFVQQRKTRLEETVWMNDSIVAESPTSVPRRDASGFFRVLDTAHQPAIPLTALLNGANGQTTPINTTGQGLGIFSLEDNALTFTLSYRGLGGAATAAHIHGPAGATSTAGVLITLEPFHSGPFGSSGEFAGTIVLTESQKALVLSGQTYANVHTTANPGGEIRGQIAPVLMQASLLSASPTTSAKPGASGLGTFTLVGSQLTFSIDYRGLSGAATMAHIHGPAAIGQNAGVLVDLAPYNGGAYGDGGGVAGSVSLTTAQLAAVIDGQTYVNFHTTANPGGELRGQIMPQSLAVPLTALLSGLNERPTPLINNASGQGLFSIEGNVLTLNIDYRGLSGPATAAHIHGPTNTTGSAGVQINLQPLHRGAYGTEGSFAGSVVLTPAQRRGLAGGQTYVNIHTAANPGGEARGQIASVLMVAGASGPAERPTAIVTTGSGLGLFALVGARLDFNVVYRGLSGVATGAHIHGPATPSQTAGILVDFAPFTGAAYGTSGGISGTTTLPPTVLANLIDSLGYVNFHTAANPPGEIRGQILR